jgi:ribonuclease HII
VNPLFSFDKNYYDKGLISVAGIDEAGRGPLAGPVAAAAVIFPKDIEIPFLNDSKKLTEKKRNELFKIIKEKALAYSVATIDNVKIDEVNILRATFMAMKQAVLNLKISPQLCLIDGNHKIPELALNQEAIVGGDAKSASIAAASILAKVTRDAIMLEYAKEFPMYGFEKHKGYGTKTHMDALKKYGVCRIHRQSFAPVKLCSQEQKWLIPEK